jgi:hypothetical protein
MVSLWGSKQNDQEDNADDESDTVRGSSTNSQQPRLPDESNERSRLLPRREQGPGYLHPDDPAVCVSLDSRLISLTSLGISIQPLECTCPTMVRSFIPRHHFHLVGVAFRLHLRESS